MNFKTKHQPKRTWIVTLIAILLSTCIQADDIDVFVNPSVSGVKPNLLLVLDLSDSMDYTPSNGVPTTGNPSKIDILKTAMNEILDDPILIGNVNIGLQTFQSKYSSVGAPIIFPVADPEADANSIDPAIPTGTTVRQVLKNQIQVATTDGYMTPILNALYEATRYYRGMPLNGVLDLAGEVSPLWNQAAIPPHYNTATDDKWRTPHRASYTGEAKSEPILTQTLLSTPGSSIKYCYDYSSYGSSDLCVEYKGITLDRSSGWMSCTPITYGTCSEPYVYGEFEDPGNCSINAPGTSSPWICGGDSGNNTEFWCIQPNKTSTSSKACCSATADETGTECKSWTYWYRTSICPGTMLTKGYDRCTFEINEDYSSVADTRQYISPIKQACQPNNILLLTDGAPASQVEVDSAKNNSATDPTWPYRVRKLIAENTGTKSSSSDATAAVVCEDLSSSLFSSSANSVGANCSVELTNFLKTVSQIPSIPDSKVNLHAIAFGDMTPGAKQFLQRLATEKRGGVNKINYHEATSLDSLKNAIKTVISAAGADNFSFSGVSINVNSNRLSSSEKTFINVFKPTPDPIWPGNSKGYFLGVNGLEDINRQPATVTRANGVEQFKFSAQSFWSSSADGNDVSAGGLLNKIDPTGRSMYFTVETDSLPTLGGSPSALDITSATYQLTTTNNARLTKERMGMPETASDTDQTDLINWARQKHMGESLHTKPTLIDFGAEASGGIEQVLFIATNEGILHGFDVTSPAPGSSGDSSGGNELFAFMPAEMLKNLNSLKTNTSTSPHIYGIDGPMSIWREAGADNKINESSDHAYLYFGMRRGGGAYYAMDVTDPSRPKIKWRIDNSATGFSKLGQSWSRMSLTDVFDNGKKRKVLIFGGGYDSDQDTKTTQSADDSGLGIYMVDADSGQLLMSIGPNATEFFKENADMNQSIPSDIRLIDSNGNGVTDRLYFGDMGSNVWRVDFNESESITNVNSFNVYKLANLSDATITEAGNRRFYYPPSITLTMHNKEPVLAVAIGSGFRAQPFNAINQDKFFVIFDRNYQTGNPDPSSSTLSLANLHNTTDNTIQDDAENTAFHNSSGWYFDLDTNEKVLSESLIFDNKLLFSAYQPELSSSSSCGISSNALYVVDLNSAKPVIPQNIDTDSPGSEQPPAGFAGIPYRKININNSSIAGSPTLVFLDPAVTSVSGLSDSSGECANSAQIYSGSEKLLDISNCIHNIFWRESSE